MRCLTLPTISPYDPVRALLPPGRSGDAAGWAALFTPDGRFEVVGATLDGTAQLAAMPGMVAQHGGGTWPHQVTNIAATAGDDADGADVVAYGLVTDWQDGGKPVSFIDYRIALRRIDGAGRIATLVATPV